MAPAVADAGPDGNRIRARLRDEALAAPDLLRIEVMSVVRRHAGARLLTATQAHAAIEDLLALPLIVFPTAPLLRRAWALRANVTAYDGCYVALAEALGAPLLTAHMRLAEAPHVRCEIETA